MSSLIASERNRISSSDSENDMENLFHIIDEEDEVFTFDIITIEHLQSSQELEITFHYSVNRSDVFISKVYVQIDGLNEEICSSLLIHDTSLVRIIFSLGMCVLQWFWMGFGSGKIEISASVAEQVELDKNMLEFWRHVYEPMIAEFLFVNRIPDKEVTLEVSSTYSWPSNSGKDHDIEVEKRGWCDGASVLSRWKETYSVIVPLGGGKDSLVVWQLAKEAGQRPLSLYVSDGLFEFSLNWRLPALVAAMKPSDKQEETPSSIILVKHIFIDEQFKRLSRSYLEPCGHPWAAVVLFDSLLVAWITGIPKISLGYEKSADEGNGVFVCHNRVEVNHQYDKSQLFMTAAQQYIAEHIDPTLVATSRLSHLWELEIARIFCENPGLKPFHSLFLSCNEPVQHTHWCAKCDKCAFIFLLIAAWLGVEYATKTVFQGVNMLNDIDKIPVFLRLIDASQIKPFDCVGTVVEAREAISLILAQQQRTEDGSFVLNYVGLSALEEFMAAHPL